MKASALLPAKFLLLALSLCVTARAAVAAPTTSYPQPQPSDREQYLLELMNAARANPASEGQMLAGITDSEILRYYSYYHVAVSGLASTFAGYAAKPPLAFNAALMTSSHAQAAYQASAGVQTHDSADGTTFDKRITAAGYKWSGIGENSYAYAENPFFGHVGLIVDWGVPSYDHRANLLNIDPNVPTFREVGIACADSSVKNFGPLVITEDFGTPADSTLAYVTGVVYQDNNGNGSYDEGEGLGGVTITPDSGDNYAVTTSTGGFQIPLPASGSGTLTITANGGSLGGPRVKTISYTAGTNVKVDFTPADAVAVAPLPVISVTAAAQVAIPSTQVGQIVVSRDGDTSKALKVNLGFGGNAVNGVDCNPIPNKVTIPAGQASVTLAVQPTDGQRSGVVTLDVSLKAKKRYQRAADPSQVQTSVSIYPAP